MPSSDQSYTGLFPFSRSKSFFTSSRSKGTNQVINITPPIHSVETTTTSNTPGEEKTDSIQSTSTVNSRDSDSPPPIVIPTRTSSKASKRSSRHRYSQSITNTVDLASLRRSVSLRSVSSPQSRHYRQPSTATLAASVSHDNLPTQHHHKKLHIPTFGRRNKSAENFREGETSSPIDSTKREMLNSAMTTVQYRNAPLGRPPTSHSAMSSVNYSQTSNGTMVPAPSIPNMGPGTQNPNVIYQHILDTASKRISTLDYLRKAYVQFRRKSTWNLQLTAVTAMRAEYTGSIPSFSRNPISSSFLTSSLPNSPVAQRTTSFLDSPSPQYWISIRRHLQNTSER